MFKLFEELERHPPYSLKVRELKTLGSVYETPGLRKPSDVTTAKCLVKRLPLIGQLDFLITLEIKLSIRYLGSKGELCNVKQQSNMNHNEVDTFLALFLIFIL